MQFDSINEFFAMGGYGFFVWLSFGVSFFALFALLWFSHWQQGHLFKLAHRELQRAERIKVARKAKKTDPKPTNDVQD